ncbi:hypothetical protein [Acidovorax sp.]|uniref:hypothetical protein n=1 Tax=Acidovorax sp. TaxID=1872122 RepID=UPI00391FC79B
MTSASDAFHPWLASEEDVRDANALLMYYVRADDHEAQPGQLAVVHLLRAEASKLLLQYLAVMKDETARLDHREPEDAGIH